MAKKTKAKKVTEINSATHIALPLIVFNELSNLVGKQISWGIADATMSKVKASAVTVELVEDDVPETPARKEAG